LLSLNSRVEKANLILKPYLPHQKEGPI
jgi:hypothetical protein